MHGRRADCGIWPWRWGSGLLTSVYYLTFAAAQIRFGILLTDMVRADPKCCDGRCSSGRNAFAVSTIFLLLWRPSADRSWCRRIIDGGLKALVLWFPRERVPLLNGLMIMLGALCSDRNLACGILMLCGLWRLFELLAIASAGCALVIYLVVPDMPEAVSGAGRPTTAGL
jgi:hypothetical protein